MRHLALTLFLLIFSASLALAQGVVRGKITDEFGLGLPGANVVVSDPLTGTVTDVNGEYILFNIPAGAREIQVSFIGYGDFAITVQVEAGKSITQDASLVPGVTFGEEILVLGDRLKGQAKALNQQKNNINITNIVAADQIGRFPDANVGDAVKRIPGITMQGDQGEARNIIIRGLAPQLNSVMINGERVPSAEGDNRNIQMDLIPSDMIQTIEVNKAVTPDMDADAIGGAVNLVTRAAPEGMRISATAASGYNFLSQKPIWTGALVYGNRFAKDRIGLTLSGSYNDHKFGSDNVEALWNDEAESPFTGEDTTVTPYTEEFEIRNYVVQRIRRSISANLDFKLSESHVIFIRSMYNWRDDWENRFRLGYEDIVPVFDDNGATIGYEGEIYRQLKGGANTDRLKSARLEDQRVINLALQGDHLFANKLKVDWMATYSRASEERLQERYLEYAVDDEIGLNLALNDPFFPLVTPADAGDAEASNFEFKELTEENQYTEEADFNARLDFELPVNIGGQNGSIKFGGRLRNKNKFRDNNFFEFEPLTSDYDNLELTNPVDYSEENYLAGEQYAVGLFPTEEFIGNLPLDDDKVFEASDVPDEYLPVNYNATEQITGGYLMWNQAVSSKFSVLAGIRFENTNLEYTGNQILDEDLIGEISDAQNYSNFLPGVHLRYNPTDNFVLRGAWTNTLARPNYFDLVPFQNIVSEDEEIIRGNSELNPTQSMNFDLMAENYFQSIGLVSGGVFYKDITDFIYTFVDEEFVDPILTGGNEWVLFEPRNGGEATLFGVEIAFQRQLDFLPGALKGLGIYANYTFTRSNATGIRNEDGELREDISLPGTAPHMVNASLSYETKRLVLRASLNYSHDYIDEVGSGDFSDRFYDRQLFLDFNGSYAFTENLRFFVEFNNLTNQPLRYYQGIRERTQQVEYYNARFNAGLKFDLFRQ